MEDTSKEINFKDIELIKEYYTQAQELRTPPARLDDTTRQLIIEYYKEHKEVPAEYKDTVKVISYDHDEFVYIDDLTYNNWVNSLETLYQKYFEALIHVTNLGFTFKTPLEIADLLQKDVSEITYIDYLFTAEITEEIEERLKEDTLENRIELHFFICTSECYKIGTFLHIYEKEIAQKSHELINYDFRSTLLTKEGYENALSFEPNSIAYLAYVNWEEKISIDQSGQLQYNFDANEAEEKTENFITSNPKEKNQMEEITRAFFGAVIKARTNENRYSKIYTINVAKFVKAIETDYQILKPIINQEANETHQKNNIWLLFNAIRINVAGVLGLNSFSPVMNYYNIDFEKNEISLEFPYFEEIMKILNFDEEFKKAHDEEYKGKIKLPISTLKKNSFNKEKNYLTKAAANIIIIKLERYGEAKGHSAEQPYTKTIKALIDETPELKRALEEKKSNANRTTVLKRAIYGEKFMKQLKPREDTKTRFTKNNYDKNEIEPKLIEVFRKHTDIFDKWADVEIYLPNDISFSNIENRKITIKHGKRSQAQNQ